MALVVFAGKEYGSGSSRDWAAKGPNLMGVRAAIAESFERIHRSNLVMMGIVPLEFMPGETMASLGLKGDETFTIRGLDELARGEADRRGDLTRREKDIHGPVARRRSHRSRVRAPGRDSSPGAPRADRRRVAGLGLLGRSGPTRLASRGVEVKRWSYDGSDPRHVSPIDRTDDPWLGHLCK